MVTFAHILCPVDMSDTSRRAFAQASALSREYGAKIAVLEVVEVALPPMSSGPALYALDAVTRRALLEELDRLVEPARTAGVAVEVRVREGHAVREILREAEATPTDLIVMGTHGRGGFERLVLGSVTEKVLRRATCPVWTVPPRERVPSAPEGLRTILCATDFSEPAARAVEYACSLAARTRSRLILVHAIDWPFGELPAGVPASALAALRQSLEANARERLGQAAPGEAGPGSRLDRLVTSGKPAHDIVRLATEHAVDLIVLGVRGRGAIDLALLGSTTHYVIREAPCSVLTIRTA
jgi:nucleotide-binding universal stress UspA family protein